MKDIIIDNRFRVDRQIAVGGFGMVYLGTDLQTRNEVAIKLEHNLAHSSAFMVENAAYEALSGGVGIPKVLWFGKQDDMYGMVQELLGPSLLDLSAYCLGKFSLKTVLLLADQALCRLRYMHKKGFVHRDLKPQNMAMGTGRSGNTLYLLDFGLTCRYNSKPVEGVSKLQEQRGYGTDVYMSLACHRSEDNYPRDDLESLGYILVHFLQGELPWASLSILTQTGTVYLEKIVKLKSGPLEAFCEGMPREFFRYFEYIRSLKPQDKPDYAYLRRLFRNLFSRSKFRFDNVFDWTETRLNEFRTVAAPGNGRAHEVPPKDGHKSL